MTKHIIGAFFGIYLWNARNPQTTYNLKCSAVQYVVYLQTVIVNSTEAGGFTSTTENFTLSPYSTTATVSQPSGYVSSTSVAFNGTVSGPLAIWTEEACTYQGK